MADKALLLGINEYESVGDLRGCLDDVENMTGVLTEVFGFDPKNIRTLLDQKAVKAEVQKQHQVALPRRAARPRRAPLLRARLYVPDEDGDEDDGPDEILCLHDMDFDDPKHYLLDDELRRWAGPGPTASGS